MARNKKGWLTAESLLAGEREQYAIDRSYGRVIVEIRPNPLPKEPGEMYQPWITRILISPRHGLPEERTYWCFRLDAARRKFTQLQKQHP